MKPHLKQEQGFTLLELLMSMALIVILAAACLQSVRLAIASRDAGSGKADRQQRLRILHERLNSTIRSAHVIFISPQSSSLLPENDNKASQSARILAFEGRPDSLKLVTFIDPLLEDTKTSSMHQVRFYLQKDESSGKLELLMNERPFSPDTFFKDDDEGLERGHTLVIAQDVAYLKFQYYREFLDEGKSQEDSGENQVKVSGEWTDKFIAEPFDFKSNIGDNRNTGDSSKFTPLPRAVKVSAGLWGPEPPSGDQEQSPIEMPSVVISIQTGLVFEPSDLEEDSDVPTE